MDRLVDLGLPVLPVDTAQRRVIIEGVALQFVEIMEVLGARVDDIGAAARNARISRRSGADKVERVHRHIDDGADRIARI